MPCRLLGLFGFMPLLGTVSAEESSGLQHPRTAQPRCNRPVDSLSQCSGPQNGNLAS